MDNGLLPATADDLTNAVNIERLLTMARHQPVAAVAHAINVTVLAVVSWPEVNRVFLTSALALFYAGAVWQLYAWFRNRGRRRPSKVSNRTITRITAWAAGFGILWGVFAGGLMYQQPTLGLQVIICTVIAGMSAGGYLMLYTIPPAMTAFLLFSIGPSWLVIVMRGGAFDHALATYTFIYLSFLFISGRQAHKSFVASVALRLENAELAYQADAANRAKSRFLANMSHELRTPLNAINGFAEIIQQQFKGPVGNPQYLEFAKAIVDSGRHLVSLIDDILDLSKIEAGRTTLQESIVHAKAVVDQAVTLTRNSIDKAQLTLDVHVQDDTPAIYIDARKICQVLVNLISNAVKFTPPGGRIRLEVRRSADSGLSFLVGDTGIGIPADEIKDMLKPFVRSEEAERQQLQGAGIGLHIAQEIVKLHGGTLVLSSAHGTGTMVTVHIPAARVVLAAQQQAAG